MCTTALSPMLELSPMVTEFPSARMVAPYQTEELAPSVTSPMRLAEGAMNLDKGEMVGARESTDTIRVEGTRRSVYLATSRDAPIESRDLLSCVEFVEYVCLLSLWYMSYRIRIIC